MAMVRALLMMLIVASGSWTPAQTGVFAPEGAHHMPAAADARHHDGGCDGCDHASDVSCFSACAASVFIAIDTPPPQRPDAAAAPSAAALARPSSRAPAPEPTPPRQRA
jgi:hypothetical protein